MEGRIHHSCSDSEHHIERIVDGCCNGMEQQRLMRGIETCPRCLDKYERQQSFKTFIQSKISRVHVSNNLIDSIREKLDSGRY